MYLNLEKEMATHSSILAWRISWTEEPGGLQSLAFQELDTTWQLDHVPEPALWLQRTQYYNYLGLWNVCLCFLLAFLFPQGWTTHLAYISKKLTTFLKIKLSLFTVSQVSVWFLTYSIRSSSVRHWYASGLQGYISHRFLSPHWTVQGERLQTYSKMWGNIWLEKTLESPLDYKEIKPVNPLGNQPWIFIGGTAAEAEAEAPILWPPKAKSQLTGKDCDARKDWGQEEKRVAEDEMVVWHHWLNGHEFEQTLGNSEGQKRLACSSPWDCKELDTT